MQSHHFISKGRFQRIKANRCLVLSLDQWRLREFRGITNGTAVTKEQTGSFDFSKLRLTNSTQSSVTRMASAMAAFGVVFSMGFFAGKSTSSSERMDRKPLVLPNGLPRTCCDSHDEKKKLQDPHVNLSPLQSQLPKKLKRIVGKENVLDGMVYNTETTPYLKGARLGMGRALCIVTPRHLHHVVSLVEACVEADCIILPQGQNTGLTGGSVPHQHDASRPVVLISFKHLDAVFPIDDGKRVVCMAGVGLASVRKL